MIFALGYLWRRSAATTPERVGRVAVAFPTATHRLDVALLPFLDLSVVGRILLPAVLEVVDDLLQFYIEVFNRLA